MSLAYILHLANLSFGILYILAVLLLIALAVMLDRFWFLRTTILRGQSLILHTAAHETLGLAELAALREAAGSLPEATLVDAAQRYAGRLSQAALESRLDESIMLTAPTLDRRLWVLDTVITLAPLLGLLGTIIGMFQAFNVLAQPGHAPTEVTGGVADALVSTAFGIIIAVTGLTGYNALSNQVRLVVHQLDSMKTMLVNRLEGAHAPAAAPVYTPERVRA